MTERQLLLYVVPRPNSSYGLELRQRLNGGGGSREMPVVRIWDVPLRMSLAHTLEALRHSGYRPSDLSRTRREPFALKEAAGVRLGLVFLALKPLRKSVRMERIIEAVERMPDEEVYYWFSKASSASAAQRAARMLLAGG
jgi:hypothetical protein